MELIVYFSVLAPWFAISGLIVAYTMLRIRHVHVDGFGFLLAGAFLLCFTSKVTHGGNS